MLYSQKGLSLIENNILEREAEYVFERPGTICDIDCDILDQEVEFNHDPKPGFPRPGVVYSHWDYHVALPVHVDLGGNLDLNAMSGYMIGAEG